jgi:sugar lactone lactonase YvrE
MRRLILLAAVAAIVVPIALGASRPFPQVVQLPQGFQPEGIAIGRGTTFYVGSIPTGAVFRGDLKTGKGAVLVAGASGRAAIGIGFDRRNRLFVSGGPTGKAFVYEAGKGGLLATYQLATGTGATFVNDVAVTGAGAWFTDSNRPVLYRVPTAANGALGQSPQTLQLTGDFQMAEGFNLNGIEATPDGKTLIVVQSNLGKLFTVDPSSGNTRQIDLGSVALTNGDGLLLQGRTLYVVQNQLNRIAVVQLSPDLTKGTVLRNITDPDFDVPTTIDRFGARLYAVNARFGTTATPTTPYQVVRVG